MADPESTTSRIWNSDIDDDNAFVSGKATTIDDDDDDDDDDGDDDGDNDTNDYSSYWQSIPDPPTLADNNAAAAATSFNSVASEEEEVPKKKSFVTTTTSATLRGGTLRTITAASFATFDTNDKRVLKKPSGATSAAAAAMVEGGMRRIRNHRKLRCGDSSTTFAFRDVTNRCHRHRRFQNSNDNSLKKKKKKTAAVELNDNNAGRLNGRRNEEKDNVIVEGDKKKRTKRHGTILLLSSDENDEGGILKSSGKVNSQYAVYSVDASLSSEGVRNSRLLKSQGGVDSRAVSVDTMEAENVDSGNNTKNQMAENKIHSERTALMGVSGGPIGASKEERLIQLVRDYCSLPLKHRIHSTESKEIESLSSYPMPDRMHPSSHDNKEEFLSRVQPIVREMERRKQKDAMDTRLATGCEARKDDGRGGGYRYYEVDGGKMVRSKEYERRYVAMLDERRRKRRLEDWADRRSNDDSNAECEEKLHDSSEERTSDDSIRNFNVEEYFGRDSAEEDHSHNHSNDDEEQKLRDSSEEQGSDDSNMDMDESVCMDDSPTSMLLPSPVASSDGTLGALASNCLLGGCCSKDLPDNIGSSDGDIVNSPDKQHCESNRDSQEHGLLAGMPPTNDPRVVAARKTLWHAIDTALANYSREILAMEESTENDTADT